jgi:hypothetical protein
MCLAALMVTILPQICVLNHLLTLNCYKILLVEVKEPHYSVPAKLHFGTDGESINKDLSSNN